jgi:hypothetical protein
VDFVQAELGIGYSETIRDTVASAPNELAFGVNEDILKARLAVHEIGHQLLKSNTLNSYNLMEHDGSWHRNNGSNIMHFAPGKPMSHLFYFDPREIAAMRMRRASP